MRELWERFKRWSSDHGDGTDHYFVLSGEDEGSRCRLCGEPEFGYMYNYEEDHVDR